MSKSDQKVCFLCSKIIRKNSNISLHKFPSDIEIRSLWQKKCGLNDKKFTPNLLICSIHFKKNAFESFSLKILKPKAIPTMFIKRKKKLDQLQNSDDDNDKLVGNAQCDKGNTIQCCSYTSINNQLTMKNIKNFIESSKVPIIFSNMLDDWEPFKWNLDKWNNIFENQSLDCRKGKITCAKEPLWENKCTRENYSFSNIVHMSKHIKKNGNWLYFDYKYIGEKVDEKIFQSISWKKFGYDRLGAKDSTLWIGSTGAHTPCHQDLYGVNLVAQVHGKKRWILMPPEMGKYLNPSRIPYEESSCYSKINFSCPDNIKNIDDACKCISVTLSPGDVLFVPHKWWHYVENLTTAISINTWIQTPKYDNMARLNESVVRFMVSSICSGVSDNIQLQLLNPNEVFSSSTNAESIHFINQSIKMIESEEDTPKEDNTDRDSIEPDSTQILKYQYEIYQAEQSLSKVELDTKYHRYNHTENSSKPNMNNDTSLLLDAFCNENVINQIVSNLIKK